MEDVVERENLKTALAQVKRNKGAAGIDGMSVNDLPAYLKEHWPAIRAQLLDGIYKPQPVRRVEIPKVSGGVRLLGIPTVLDRFIQQAVMQVLQADWDRTFSETSFGFRAGRSAQLTTTQSTRAIAKVDVDQGIKELIVLYRHWCEQLDRSRRIRRCAHGRRQLTNCRSDPLQSSSSAP